MVSVKTIGDKLDFVRNCYAESAAYLFYYYQFHLIPIIEIKIFETNPCLKKICFRKSISNFHTLLEINERSFDKNSEWRHRGFRYDLCNIFYASLTEQFEDLVSLFTVIIGRKLGYG